MSSLLKEIEELKHHTELALKRLEEREFELVRKELEKILVIDLVELRKLHKEGGSQLVLKRCEEVLKNAKEALYTVNHLNWELVQGIITKIYHILNHEEAEEMEFEKEEEQL